MSKFRIEAVRVREVTERVGLTIEADSESQAEVIFDDLYEAGEIDFKDDAGQIAEWRDPVIESITLVMIPPGQLELLQRLWVLVTQNRSRAIESGDRVGGSLTEAATEEVERIDALLHNMKQAMEFLRNE